MNNQQLNNAFDTFAPTQEQRERMFANIMVQKDAPMGRIVHWSKVYIPASCVAAAALIFVLAGGLFGSESPVPVADNTVVYNNSSVVATDTQLAVKSGADDSAESIQTDKISDAASATDTKPDKETKVTYDASANKAKSPVAQTPVAPVADTAQPVEQTPETNTDYDKVFTSVIEQQQSASEQVQEVEPVVPDSVTEYALNINNVSANMRSKMTAIPEDSVDMATDVTAYNRVGEFYAMDSSEASGGGGGAAVSGGGSSAADGYDMTYAQFCQKIGTDIKSAISVPADMSDITDDTNYVTSAHQTVFEWNVIYTGDDTRIINITVSNDVEQNKQYFENDTLVKTNINGVDAVVMADGGSYTAYIIKNNVSYTVNTNITEQELTELIVSIG